MGKYNNVDSVCTINVSNKIVQQKKPGNRLSYCGCEEVFRYGPV